MIALTSDDFRKSPDKRMELLGLLANDTLAEALNIVKSKGETEAVPAGLSGIDVGMILASRTMRAIIFSELLEMTKPLPEPKEDQPAPDFGTKFNADQFDQTETEPTHA